MTISDPEKLSKVHDINSFSEADLFIYPLLMQAEKLPSHAGIIEDYLKNEPSWNDKDKILGLLAPNPYSERDKEAEISSDTEKLAAYYSMLESISWYDNGIYKSISLYNDLSSLEPLSTCFDNIEMVFSKSYQEYNICEANKRKVYFKVDGNIDSEAYEILIPLQYRLSKIDHERVKVINDNIFVYKLNDNSFVSISSYKAVINTDEIYIGFSRNPNIEYGYKANTGAQFSSGKSLLLPGKMFLRFNDIYIKMKYWSSNI